MIVKICRECQNEFNVFLSRDSQRYCSHSCFMKDRNKANPELRYSARTKRRFNISNEVRIYIDGLLLGDASIQKGTSHATRLTQTFSRNHLDWAEKIHNDLKVFGIESMIGSYDIFDKRTNEIYHTVYLQTKFYPEFKIFYSKWYYRGKKEVPEDIILNSISITNWFLGDGSRPNGKIQLSTDSFSLQSINILREGFKQLSFKFYYNNNNGRMYLYKKKEVSKFIDLIERTPESFYYKLGVV